MRRSEKENQRKNAARRLGEKPPPGPSHAGSVFLPMRAAPHQLVARLRRVGAKAGKQAKNEPRARLVFRSAAGTRIPCGARGEARLHAARRAAKQREKKEKGVREYPKRTGEAQREAARWKPPCRRFLQTGWTDRDRRRSNRCPPRHGRRAPPPRKRLRSRTKTPSSYRGRDTSMSPRARLTRSGARRP